MPQLDVDVVSIDANVAADFALIGRLDVLEVLFRGRLLASDFVTAELGRAGIVIDCAETVSLAAEELDFFQSLRDQHRALGLGELGAICVARLRGAVVLTNDKEARQLAGELHLEVSGTLGVLKYAIVAKLFDETEASRILDQMLEHGSWFGPQLVEEFKRSLD